jgi:hypothetical protein
MTNGASVRSLALAFCLLFTPIEAVCCPGPNSQGWSRLSIQVPTSTQVTTPAL